MIARDFLLILTSIGAVQSILLGVYFISNGNKKNNPDVILGAMLIALGLRVAKSTFFIFSGEVSVVFFNLGFASHATVGPLMFLYIKYYERPDKLKWKEGLHFIPAAILLLLINVLSLEGFWHKGGYQMILYQSLAYILLTTYIFSKKNYKIKSKKRIWLLQLIIGVSLFLMAYFSNYILGITSYILGPIINTIVIYLITYFLLVNYNFLFSTKKYKYLNIDDQLIREYSSKVETTIQKNKPFLKADFNLTKLSELTGIPGYTLSYVFSNHFGKKFSDFVNEYRVVEAKQKLEDPNNNQQKISSIAYECGFSSLSAFNAAFKKFTNTTPSSYREEKCKLNTSKS